MSSLIEELGNRYGWLTVIGRAEREHRKATAAYWLCKCGCGQEVVISGRTLREGNTRSCGCRKRAKRLGWGEASFNCLLKDMKRGAVSRGLEWGLTREQVKDITKQNCHYCGVEPRQSYGSDRCYGRYFCNGIDRINNEIGYIESNVTPCCKTCNYMKSATSQIDFINHCLKIAHNNE